MRAFLADSPDVLSQVRIHARKSTYVRTHSFALPLFLFLSLSLERVRARCFHRETIAELLLRDREKEETDGETEREKQVGGFKGL